MFHITDAIYIHLKKNVSVILLQGKLHSCVHPLVHMPKNGRCCSCKATKQQQRLFRFFPAPTPGSALWVYRSMGAFM